MLVPLCSLLRSPWLFTLSVLFHCFSQFFLQKELSAGRKADFDSESQFAAWSNYQVCKGHELQGFYKEEEYDCPAHLRVTKREDELLNPACSLPSWDVTWTAEGTGGRVACLVHSQGRVCICCFVTNRCKQQQE